VASITITKKITQTDERFRLRVWVSETSDNIPATVFLMERIPGVPGLTDPYNRFIRVCNYSDMLHYTATTPQTENPYFRLPGVDLIFTSYNQLNTYFTDTIHAEVQVLIDDIVDTNTAPVVTIIETVP